ncbi:pentatricopeptide repeat-containing protein At5g16860-like [Selaginella moellendorffii]|uniref:pentatricopeptide repeat-containing protein At5g16860-like n=1 Tax=Selaginella moellendorffii TaxID=88036 RepID=UPI000D1CA787|nr:pentatricopeptide repeat-containing protein At5g16860-like [Selaginella moellendorffii]|eukprot:XP_024533611.1 pentatricopeptide repeat-containing protein At5g16860-like [Selaginella moellendorffii]
MRARSLTIAGSFFRQVLLPQQEQAVVEREAATGIFVAALKACTGTRDLQTGRKIHGDALVHGPGRSIYVENSLVSMYGKCGRMADARGVFEGMKLHSVVSWTSLIMGYVDNGENELALQQFSRMQQEEQCAPNERTFVAAMMACSTSAARELGKKVDGKLLKAESLERGIKLHEQAEKSGYCEDVFVASTLIDMYAKCGSLADARKVFDKMVSPTVVSWTALILGYAENGEPEMALQLFQLMDSKGCLPNSRTFVALFVACGRLATKEEGKHDDGSVVKPMSLEKGTHLHSRAAKLGFDSDMFVASSLIDMYTRCGSLSSARAVFDGIKTGHDVVTWTGMIQGYAENGESDAALKLFQQMRACNCAPNSQTYVAVLLACGNLAALDSGRSIHAEIYRNGLEDNQFLSSQLLDFYGKCGSSGMEQVFDSLPTRTSITWSALIAGYSCQGRSQDVFHAFESMREECIQVDNVTFLCVLSACSHGGLVQRGKQYFAMLSEHGITPSLEHYHCMVDLLGRANHLEEALAMIENTPFKPTLVTWMTVLGACGKWKDVKTGRYAFESLLKINPSHTPAFVLMANIYGSVRMLEEQRRITPGPLVVEPEL